MVNPREETYKVTPQEWLIQGMCLRRIFPTICVQRCSVSSVGCHSAGAGNSGQGGFCIVLW
ncbi:MAG: hypothetical protein WD625_10230 [Balneolales bacterium]